MHANYTYIQERVYQLMGRTVSPLRTNLKPVNVNILTCLNLWNKENEVLKSNYTVRKTKREVNSKKAILLLFDVEVTVKNITLPNGDVKRVEIGKMTLFAGTKSVSDIINLATGRNIPSLTSTNRTNEVEGSNTNNVEITDRGISSSRSGIDNATVRCSQMDMDNLTELEIPFADLESLDLNLDEDAKSSIIQMQSEIYSLMDDKVISIDEEDDTNDGYES